jgi:hypothetical protein
LSGSIVIPSQEMTALFSNQAILSATDGSELLRGRDPVAKFFHTLASWRKRSSGTWELTNATLAEWKREDNLIVIVVDYCESLSVPGSSAPSNSIVVKGRDRFVLDDSAYFVNGTSTTIDVEDDYEIVPVIRRIEQQKLQIGDGGVGGRGRGRNPDGQLWFIKSLISALDAGKLTTGVGGDSVVMELLQRVIAGDIAGSGGRSRSSAAVSGANSDDNGPPPPPAAIKKRRRKVVFPPKLSEQIAAKVYTIMAQLHQEMPALLDKDNLRTYQLPPLHKFLNEKVELRGYLGETLARGRASYNRAVAASFSSLRAVLATGGVSMIEQQEETAQPAVTCTVELTAEGNVRLKLILGLKVLPLPSGAGDLIKTMSRSAISLPSGGFPLKIAILSEYVVDSESGDIYQHRLLETRINDQLTPGDVVSRWLQTQVAMNPKGGGDDAYLTTNSEMNNGADLRQNFVDAISWLRSIGSN